MACEQFQWLWPVAGESSNEFCRRVGIKAGDWIARPTRGHWEGKEFVADIIHRYLVDGFDDDGTNTHRCTVRVSRPYSATMNLVMPGLRTGWIVGPQKTLAKLCRYHD